MAKLYKITFANGMIKELTDEKIALCYIREYIEDCSGMSDEELLRHNFSYKIEELERPLTELSYNDLVESGYVAREFLPIDKKNMSAIKAIDQLFTLARAWNKEDGFVPDFSDWGQAKWFPWFAYDKDAARFVYAHTLNAPTNANASIGYWLCFKTSERAAQFGKQFEDLYNKAFGIER